LDDSGYFVGFSIADESPLESGVFMFPRGTVEELPPSAMDGFLLKWVDGIWIHEPVPVPEPEPVPDPAPEPEPPTQFELDQNRYQKRAAVKDSLIAWMAADNMSRVRSGLWTVPDLVALSGDPEIAALLNDINTLSFELAVSRLSGITNPMLTPEIKSDWAARLTDHFYLVP
jgi:hypothetical protein